MSVGPVNFPRNWAYFQKKTSREITHFSPWIRLVPAYERRRAWMPQVPSQCRRLAWVASARFQYFSVGLNRLNRTASLSTISSTATTSSHSMYASAVCTGVDRGGSGAQPPNGRAKKNCFVKIEGLSSFTWSERRYQCYRYTQNIKNNLKLSALFSPQN